MPSVSQNTLIDTIKKTTLLDEKATIANGNLLKQGAELDTLYRQSKVLIDSLRSEINISNLQIVEYKTVKVPALENLVIEKTTQGEIDNENNGLIIGALKADLKTQRGKKWKFGVVGTLLGILIGIFAGI